MTVKAIAGDGYTIVEVSDTGIGMTQDLVDNVLRWDHRKSRMGTAGERGSGFGLVLVQDLVEDWGGTVEIASQPSQGTTVRVSFRKP